MAAKDTKSIEDKVIEKELSERHYPPLEVAKARIGLALLKYKVAVERSIPASEKEKERL